MVNIKHKRLYKIFSLLEDIITCLIAFACIIVFVSVPTNGIYTFGLIVAKIIAITLFWVIIKIETCDDE